MAAAVPLSPDSTIASAATDASASTIYEVRGHRKYWLKETRDGQTAVGLSNFEARIVAEVARGDGVEEIRHFVLKGTVRECATLGRKARGMTHKMIAFDFGISINTVGNLAANALLLWNPRRFRPHPRASRGEPLDIVLPMTSSLKKGRSGMSARVRSRSRRWLPKWLPEAGA